MEELGAIWSSTYQESTDELKKELMYSSFELESVKCKATENQQNVTNLLNLLEAAYQERDEARNQLKTIFEKMNTDSTPINQLPNHAVLPVSPPVLMPTTAKANLSLTESSSPCSIDSLFDHAVTSPEFPNLTMPYSSTMGIVNVKQPNVVPQFNIGSTNVTMSAQSDLYSQIVDDFAKGKTLPEKGKLLQAMKEAGPLLRNLLIAGAPLATQIPISRIEGVFGGKVEVKEEHVKAVKVRAFVCNYKPLPASDKAQLQISHRAPKKFGPALKTPPPLRQPFKLPPIYPINGGTRGSPLSFNQNPLAISNSASTSYFNMAHTSSAANAMLSFNNVLPSTDVSCFNNSMGISNSGFDHQIPIAKRQRLL